MQKFIGVKVALIHAGKVLVMQRDNKPGLRYANLWDLPGGGREADETPFECINRELYEELGIRLNAHDIVWERTYAALNNPTDTTCFMVAPITQQIIDAIQFGKEGQGWKMLPLDTFMVDPTVIDAYKSRLQEYLENLT